jgi:hypothetical protein
MTDNHDLARHLRKDHGVTGGWVCEPIPDGDNYALVLDDIHAEHGAGCTWPNATKD